MSAQQQYGSTGRIMVLAPVPHDSFALEIGHHVAEFSSPNHAAVAVAVITVTFVSSIFFYSKSREG